MSPKERVPWVKKTVDFMDKVYWTLKYVGLEKVGYQSDGSITYARIRNGPAQTDYLLGQEEFLNQAFDIAFAIAPDALTHSVFLAPLGLADQGPFTSVGREVSSRQMWPKGATYLQQDGLFVGATSALAVELKTGSSTNLGQTLKYICLLALEEAASGLKAELGLIYIVNSSAVEKTKRQVGVGNDMRLLADLDVLRQAKAGKALLDYLADHRAEVEDVRRRLRVEVISWTEFDERLERAAMTLASPDAGGQTLHRLVDGLRIQIRWQTGEGKRNWPL